MQIQLLEELAEMIKNNIKSDFEKVHLSGNLMNTIKVSYNADGFQVEIPAEMYDIALYKKDKVLKFTGKGSYAQEVNETGGHSGKHKNYVERAIETAINEWIKKNNLNVKGVYGL